MLPGLKSLIGPLEPERFFERYWQTLPYVTRAKRTLLRQLAGELEDFEIHRLLERHSGTVQAWFSEAGEFRSEKLSISAAHAAYEDGVTLYLHQLNVANIARWQKRLAQELGHFAKILNCSIFAAKCGAGTRCHFDSLENITIQLRGRKTWRLAPNLHVEFPLDNWVTGTPVPDELALYCKPPMPREMPDPRRTLELRPGDVLYVPRGHWHSTEDSAESLSLFLGFPAAPSVDLVLSCLRSHLLRSASWRANFIDAGAGGAWRHRARNQIASLLRSLEAQVADLSADDILAMQVIAPEPRDRTLVRRNPLATMQLRPSASMSAPEVVITVHRGRFSSESRFKIEQRLIPICRWIGQQNAPFEVADAAARMRNLPKASVRALLRKLAARGFLSYCDTDR
jgi:50S ribosomal protein L16 3-hydroxylase